MTDQMWQQAWRIYRTARELPKDQQRSYIASASADPDVLEEVTLLIEEQPGPRDAPSELKSGGSRRLSKCHQEIRFSGNYNHSPRRCRHRCVEVGRDASPSKCREHGRLGDHGVPKSRRAESHPRAFVKGRQHGASSDIARDRVLDLIDADRRQRRERETLPRTSARRALSG